MQNDEPEAPVRRFSYLSAYALDDGTPVSAMSPRAIIEALQDHAHYKTWLAFGTIFEDTQRHLV